jgi:hypothetical protein
LLLKGLKHSRISGCLIRDDRPGTESVSLKVAGGSGNLIYGNLLGTAPQIDSGVGWVKDNVHPK